MMQFFLCLHAPSVTILHTHPSFAPLCFKDGPSYMTGVWNKKVNGLLSFKSFTASPA